MSPSIDAMPPRRPQERVDGAIRGSFIFGDAIKATAIVVGAERGPWVHSSRRGHVVSPMPSTRNPLKRWVAGAAAAIMVAGVIAAAQTRQPSESTASSTSPDFADATSPLPLAEGSGPGTSPATSAAAAPGSPSPTVSPSADTADGPPSTTGSPSIDAPNPIVPCTAWCESHGITADEIRIGLQYVNSDAANAGVGAVAGRPSDGFSGDPVKAGEAVIDYLNERGGIAGRKIVPVWHETNVANATTPSGRDQNAQSACTTYTEDHKVFAFQNPVSALGYECARRTETLLFGYGYQAYISESQRSEAPNLWYAGNWLIADRREANLVHALAKQGFFEGDAKVGILIEDTPATREAVDRAMVPTLADYGVKDPVKIVYPDMIQSPWDNYILQLKSAGVTHVLMSSTSGCIWSTVFAMRAAESQRYRPRWGLATDNCPAGLNALGAPREQLERAQGMGWAPSGDVGDTAEQSVNTTLCREITQAADQGTGPNFFQYCEMLFFFKQAWALAGEMSPTGLNAAMRALGSNYQAMNTIQGATRFAPDRPDGPSIYRALVFDARCGEDGNSCFEYVGDAHPLP